MIRFPETITFWANSTELVYQPRGLRSDSQTIRFWANSTQLAYQPRDDLSEIWFPEMIRFPGTIRFPDDQILSKLNPAGLSAARSEMIGWGRPRETLPCNKAALWLTHDRYPTREVDDDQHDGNDDDEHGDNNDWRTIDISHHRCWSWWTLWWTRWWSRSFMTFVLMT